MSTDLNSLLTAQKEIHGQIARSVSNLKKLGESNITLSAVETRITIIDSLWEKFENQHELIRAAYKEKYHESEYVRQDFFDTVENAYVQQKSLLSEYANKLRAASPTATPVVERRVESAPKPSLPRIKLPIFSGVYEEWPAFRDLFQSVVGVRTRRSPM